MQYWTLLRVLKQHGERAKVRHFECTSSSPPQPNHPPPKPLPAGDLQQLCATVNLNMKKQGSRHHAHCTLHCTTPALGTLYLSCWGPTKGNRLSQVLTVQTRFFSSTVGSCCRNSNLGHGHAAIVRSLRAAIAFGRRELERLDRCTISRSSSLDFCVLVGVHSSSKTAFAPLHREEAFDRVTVQSSAS